MVDLKKHIIYSDEGIIKALKLINNVPFQQTLFVLDKNQKLIGTVTDGDIRRGFIKGNKLDDCVTKFMTKNFSFLKNDNANPSEIKLIKNKGVKLLPVLDKNKHIIKIVNLNKIHTILPVDVVLMAGGKGERLRPLTDTIPKPLLKIGSKPILEHNIDNMTEYGVNNFHITIRYLGEKIEKFFGNGSSKNIKINYINEPEALGTIGGLRLIKSFDHDNILLMNSDLYTNLNFEDFYNTYTQEKADMIIATIPYDISIPYAILTTNDKEAIVDLKEKPSYTYYANAGIYLFNKELIKYIPKNVKYDATDFILELIKNRKKVIKFIIYGYWFDIGNIEDFNKIQEISKHLTNE